MMKAILRVYDKSAEVTNRRWKNGPIVVDAALDR